MVYNTGSITSNSPTAPSFVTVFICNFPTPRPLALEAGRRWKVSRGKSEGTWIQREGSRNCQREGGQASWSWRLGLMAPDPSQSPPQPPTSTSYSRCAPCGHIFRRRQAIHPSETSNPMWRWCAPRRHLFCGPHPSSLERFPPLRATPNVAWTSILGPPKFPLPTGPLVVSPVLCSASRRGLLSFSSLPPFLPLYPQDADRSPSRSDLSFL